MKEELITIDKLLEIIKNQTQENGAQKEQIKVQAAQIKLLQEKIDYLIRNSFPQKAESSIQASPVSLMRMICR
jgi:hypothetical protein